MWTILIFSIQGVQGARGEGGLQPGSECPRWCGDLSLPHALSCTTSQGKDRALKYEVLKFDPVFSDKNTVQYIIKYDYKQINFQNTDQEFKTAVE